MSGQIFISYRRDDSSAWAGRLADRLSSYFPSNQIFMDVDTIEPGVDFVEAIEESVGSCDVLIAVIGTDWLTSSTRAGKRRLEIAEDSVRVEIATALKRDIRVIPVLVEGAAMPEVGDLPDDLKALVRRNALKLSHDRFRTESEQLASTVGRVLEKTEAKRREGEEAERHQREGTERITQRRESEQRERDAAEIRELQEKGQLNARGGENEKNKMLDHKPEAKAPSPVASVPSAKPEVGKLSAEIPNVAYQLPPRSGEPVPEKKRLPSPSERTGGKSPSKEIIASLAIAAVLVAGGLIYLGTRLFNSPLPQIAPIAGMTPSPSVIATPNHEEKAPSTPALAVQPSAQPTSLVAVVTPSPEIAAAPAAPDRRFLVNQGEALFGSPSISAMPTREKLARRALENATKDHPWVNSLGMKFVPVAGTQVLFSVWDTRVQDFETFVKSTGYDATGGMVSLGKDGWKPHGTTWKEPGFTQGPTHPVVGVSWNDANEFCKWLTKRERSAGDLPDDTVYRLPKDEEWSAAVGLKNEVGNTPEENSGKIELYPWEIPPKQNKSWPPPAGAGNYAGEEVKNGDWPSEWAVIEGYNDGYPRTSPVGSFASNMNGLYDMGGNVWQWCMERYNADNEGRLRRGASWASENQDDLLASSHDYSSGPNFRDDDIGFRCVVAVESSR
jgi:formylglycine-generating enzyme required for sulfatase activity